MTASQSATSNVSTDVTPVSLRRRFRASANIPLLSILFAAAACSDSSTVVIQDAEASWRKLAPTVSVVAGQNQEGTVGSVLPEALSIKAVDAAGMPLRGLSVQWTFSSGGGATSGGQFTQSLESSTDDQGKSTVNWRMGPDAGGQTARASVATVGPGNSGKGKAVNVAFNANATAGPPAVIALAPQSLDLTVGSEQDLTATVSDEFGNTLTNEAVEWHSSASTVASVSGQSGGKGRVNGKKAGSSTIVATSGSASAEASVAVSEASSGGGVATVQASPGELLFTDLNQTATVSAVAKDASGATVSGVTFAWSSSNNSVATVDAAGGVMSKGLGEALIIVAATCCGASDTVSVTVVQSQTTGTVTGIDVRPGSATVASGETQQFNAVALMSNGSEQPAAVDWSTTGGSVSASGLYSAGSTAGTFQVVAIHATGHADTAQVTVEDAQGTATVTGIDVRPGNATLNSGDSQAFSAVAMMSDGSEQPAAVTWSANGGSITTGGVYTAGSNAGTYEVTASSDTHTGTASVTISDSSPPPPPPSSSVNPELPRSYVNTSMPSITGQTIHVPAGGNLQAAINNAQPGDEILLAAGATFTGNFTLPNKGGSQWIVIRTDTNLPSAGSRIRSSDSGSLAKLQSSNTQPVIATAKGASHYRIMGVEVRPASSVSYTYNLISLDAQQSVLADIPHHIVLDRVYCHGAGRDVRRCVMLNSAHTAIINSRISGIHSANSDAQAIAGWDGPGPFKIVNNFLEASGENILFGGSDPASSTSVSPSDIEIRRNHFFKPVSWYSSGQWDVKNLFELKHAKRVLFEGNVLENNWADAQSGFAVVLKSENQSGGCSYCVTSDVTFRYNHIDNVTGAFNLAATSGPNSAIPMRLILIRDNLITRMGGDSDWGLAGNKRMFQILGAIDDLEISSNTGFVPPGGSSVTAMHDNANPGVDNLVVTDNVLTHGDYGWFGAAVGEGTAALNTFATSWAFAGNVLIGAPGNRYPPGNHFPANTSEVGLLSDHSLSSSSPYAGAGTSGSDPGADISALQAHISGVKGN